jgi:hypothetical protein
LIRVVKTGSFIALINVRVDGDHLYLFENSISCR